MQPKIVQDEYLGDGVYASFDGYNVVLDLRGQDDISRIALEPNVLIALERYVKLINDVRQEATNGK